METLALGFRQLGEVRLVQGLAILHRGEGDVRAVAVEGDILLQRQALDHIQGAVVALVEGAVDGALLLLEGGRLEHGREGGQQVIHKVLDVADEALGLPWRQLDGARLAGLVEMVDVDPVHRRFQALALGLEVALDEREAAGARLAHHIDVVAGARHGDAELQGLHRALLTEHATERLQILGGLETELLRLEGTGQRIGRQSQTGSEGIRHRESLVARQRSNGRILAPPRHDWQGIAPYAVQRARSAQPRQYSAAGNTARRAGSMGSPQRWQ
ncbi:hypothetical protein D9M68_542090 [compost metagenome]